MANNNINVVVTMNGETFTVVVPPVVGVEISPNPIPFVQLPSDWNSVTNPTQILHKPLIPTLTSQLINDSGFTENGVPANAPIVSATHTKVTYDSYGLITSGSNANQDDIGDGTTYKQYSLVDKTKLAGIASGAEVNVNADWNAVAGDSLILNKPATLTPSAHGNESHNSAFIVQADAVIPNVPIIGATKTKITYDTKGLVTSGSDATTADIADSLNKRYLTDANLVVVQNTSGTNTGDNATNSQYSGLSASKQDTLVSASNIKSINSASILGSGNLSLEPALGFTPENVANKSTSVTLDGASDIKYPSAKAVKTYVDNVITGAINYRGGYDASSNLFPSTGGTGALGVPMKGNMWIISVGGTLGGTPVLVGDSIIANVDTPGQTAGNWDILSGGISYTPEDVANKVTSVSGSSTDVQYPSAKLLYDQLALKQATGSYLVAADITGKEDTSNKVTVISGSSTNVQYPSAKLVYDQLALKQAVGAYITGVIVDSPLSGDGTSGSHLTVDLSSKQPLDSTLTALAGLDATSGFIKQTGVDTFVKDTNTYLTSLAGAMLLDQTSPQTIVNGRPTFSEGFKLGTAPTVGTFEEGKIFYDTSNKTISAMIDGDITMNIGQEELVLCYNNTGVDIPNGSMVYPTGAYGDMPTIALAKADSISTYLDIGMTTQLIPNGSSGFVTNRGIVHDIDTSSFVAGDTLYLSDTVTGGVTKVAPTDTASFVVIVGTVLIVSPTAGSIYIRQVQNNRLVDLSDVEIMNPQVDQILTYNGVEWINGNQRSISAGAGIAFYLDSTAVIPSGVQSIGLESLNKTPSIGVEEIHSVNAGSSTVPLARFIYNTALGRTKIEAGAWVFNTFCYVSNQAGTSSIPVTVRKVVTGVGTLTTTGTPGTTTRTATITGGTPFVVGDANADMTLSGSIQTSTAILRITGFTSSSVVTVEVLAGYLNQTSVPYSVHKFLFTDATTEVNNEVVGLVTSKSLQPEFTIGLTDKLSIAYYARSTAARTLYLYHGGINNYTYFETPLATLHNEIAGLQGGAGDEFYHLTSAKYSVIQNTSGTNTGDITLGTANGLVLSLQALSMNTASASVTGSLTSTDFNRIPFKDTANIFTAVQKTAGHKQAVAIKSASYTLTTTDEVIVFTANGDAILPPSTGSGQTYRVVARGATVRIVPNGTDKIKGESLQTITGNEDFIITDTSTGIWE